MDILVYLEATWKFSSNFFALKKIDLPGSYIFSQNLTNFGKLVFFSAKKLLLKKIFIAYKYTKMSVPV